MAKTLLDVRQQVRSYLDEVTPADWTDAELNRLINVFYHKVHTAAMKVFEEYAPLNTATFNLVADQQEYDLSSVGNILMLRRVEVKYDADGSDFVRAYPVNMDQVRRQLDSTAVGPTVITAVSYYLRANMLGFIPIPNENVTNGVKIWFVPQATDLEEDDDTVVLPYADRDWILIAYGAASEALRFGQQESTEADKLIALFRAGLEEMQSDLEDRVAEEAKTVIDTSGEMLDFEGGAGPY
jgi:hypothetical protein